MVSRREKDRRRAISLWLMSVLLLSGGPLFGSTALVTGTITDVDGNPLVEAEVLFEVDEVDGHGKIGIGGKVKSGSTGEFTSPFLETGSWKIYPQLEGYLLLKMSYISIDSNGNTRANETDVKISKDRSNLPAIPVPPQGEGTATRGRCEIYFVMAPEADHETEMARLKGVAISEDDHPGPAEELLGFLDEMLPVEQDVIWYNIGVNAYNKDDKAEAAQAFEKAIEENEDHADAHKMLGYTLVGLGRYKEAIPHFEVYLKLETGPEARKVAAFLEQLRKRPAG